MRPSKRILISILWTVAIFLFAGNALGYNNSPSDALLPKDLIIEDIFKPGLGAPVGNIVLVQGKVTIIHADMLHGYWAKKDLPLFKGDTIVTFEKGRIRFRLNDESIMTMASNTKLIINRSVYDPKRKSRSSFLGLDLGKVRFYVKEFFEFSRSEFKVKTPTAITGVRGSDFIVRSTPKLTIVTALEDTKLDVVSLAFPEVKPILVTDFEQTIVEEGALPTEVERVSPAEIEEMKKELKMTPEKVEPEVKLEERKEKAEKKESEKEAAKEPGAKPESPAAFDQLAPAEQKGVLVSEDELYKPEDIVTTEELEEPVVADIVEEEEISRQVEEITEQQEEISEEQFEESVTQQEATATQELPEFPGTPE